MSYNYEWNYNNIISIDVRNIIVKEIEMFIEINKKIKLKGLRKQGCLCFTIDKPIISTETIFFNGLDDPGDSFVFNFDYIQKNGKCNTHNKPYDLIVKLTLLSISNHDSHFKFSFNGTYDDWKYAIQLYQQYIGDLSLDFDRHEFRENSSDFI